MSEMVVFFNGRFLPGSQARLPLMTHAFHYGTGVFEGIRAYHDRASGRLSLFRAEDHFRRMARNTKILKLTLPATPLELTGIAAELYEADEVFLCGTAAQVAPVIRIDGRNAGNGRLGRISLQSQARYESVVRARPPGFRRWLTAVDRAGEPGGRKAEADAA